MFLQLGQKGIICFLFELAGIAAEVVVNVMPTGLHDDMDGVALPVGIHDVTAGKIVEIFAVVRIGPKAHGAIGKGALSPVDILLRKHINTVVKGLLLLLIQ